MPRGLDLARQTCLFITLEGQAKCSPTSWARTLKFRTIMSYKFFLIFDCARLAIRSLPWIDEDIWPSQFHGALSLDIMTMHLSKAQAVLQVDLSNHIGGLYCPRITSKGSWGNDQGRPLVLVCRHESYSLQRLAQAHFVSNQNPGTSLQCVSDSHPLKLHERVLERFWNVGVPCTLVPASCGDLAA